MLEKELFFRDGDGGGDNDGDFTLSCRIPIMLRKEQFFFMMVMMVIHLCVNDLSRRKCIKTNSHESDGGDDSDNDVFNFLLPHHPCLYITSKRKIHAMLI